MARGRVPKAMRWVRLDRTIRGWVLCVTLFMSLGSLSAQEVFNLPFCYEEEDVTYKGSVRRALGRVMIRSTLRVTQPGPEIQLAGKDTYQLSTLESFRIPTHVDNVFLEHAMRVKEHLVMGSCYMQIGIQMCGNEQGYRTRMIRLGMDYFSSAEAMFLQGKNEGAARDTRSLISICEKAIPLREGKASDYDDYYALLDKLIGETIEIEPGFQSEYKQVVLDEVKN